MQYTTVHSLHSRPEQLSAAAVAVLRFSSLAFHAVRWAKTQQDSIDGLYAWLASEQ